jgi:hypothetical protein
MLFHVIIAKQPVLTICAYPQYVKIFWAFSLIFWQIRSEAAVSFF